MFYLFYRFFFCPALILSVCLPLAGQALAAEAPETADPCLECHGDKGVNQDSGKDEIPTIAGASAFYLENQFLIFQKEARPCAEELFKEAKEEIFKGSDMDLPAENHCKLANDLSEEEQKKLAEYFAAQKFVPADQATDPGLAKTGGKVHKRRCDKCHAEGGSLALDDAGILAGQWKPYLVEQLRYFKEGKRFQPEKKKVKTKDLEEDDIQALAEYYASQGDKRF